MVSGFRSPSSFLGLLSCVFLLTACAQPAAYDAPQRTGTMPLAMRESSGIAASHHDPRVLWTHNDSGGQPVLYAVEPGGARRGDLRLTGATNRDWEDIASFELDGRSWLLVADTGDNTGLRNDCALYIVAEPETADLSPVHETIATVAWKIPVRYLDGPRDVEAVAVDARAGLVYLLAKRTSPHGLYTLPLRLPADGVVPAAMPVAQFPNASIPQPTSGQRMLPIPSGRFRAQPTGMDFASDGSAAVIVSYGDVMVFPRKDNEPWKDALLRPPVVLAPHGLAQAEGVCFGADNRTIYVSSEGPGSGIMRYRVAK
ncbi:hypothetical protein [Rariglobus hedericola]|uniref:hypothetical protein n=1 Tax=Rariglobus hedericola TaxID=2597822 RepID=UPI001185622C|nr:hypothetical protein [Rariglobus hedericola]